MRNTVSVGGTPIQTGAFVVAGQTVTFTATPDTGYAIKEWSPANGTKVSGYIKGSAVDNIKAHFEKWFKNKLRVIHFDRQGVWGQPVEVVVKVDLTGMDTTKLVLYVYDKAANSYQRIENPEYWIDKTGICIL